MNGDRVLAKNRQDTSIYKKDAGEFHALGFGIRQDSLKQLLGHIGIFPFITFKGDPQKPEPDQNDHSQENPGHP